MFKKDIESNLDPFLEKKIERLEKKLRWAFYKEQELMNRLDSINKEKTKEINTLFFNKDSCGMTLRSTSVSRFCIFNKNNCRIFSLHVDWNMTKVSFTIPALEISILDGNDEILLNQAISLRQKMKNGLNEKILETCRDLLKAKKDISLPVTSTNSIQKEITRFKKIREEELLRKCLNKDVKLFFDKSIKFDLKSVSLEEFNQINFEKINLKTVKVELFSEGFCVDKVKVNKNKILKLIKDNFDNIK